MWVFINFVSLAHRGTSQKGARMPNICIFIALPNISLCGSKATFVAPAPFVTVRIAFAVIASHCIQDRVGAVSRAGGLVGEAVCICLVGVSLVLVSVRQDVAVPSSADGRSWYRAPGPINISICMDYPTQCIGVQYTPCSTASKGCRGGESARPGSPGVWHARSVPVSMDSSA